MAITNSQTLVRASVGSVVYAQGVAQPIAKVLCDTVVKSDQTLFKASGQNKMSAIKTHDVYNVIHGDDLVVAQEGGEKRFKVTSMLLQRDRPSVCQIFTASENTGSLASSETKAFNCKVVSTEPSRHSTKFNLKAVVGTETQEIALTSVKTQSSECTIC